MVMVFEKEQESFDSARSSAAEILDSTTYDPTNFQELVSIHRELDDLFISTIEDESLSAEIMDFQAQVADTIKEMVRSEVERLSQVHRLIQKSEQSMAFKARDMDQCESHISDIVYGMPISMQAEFLNTLNTLHSESNKALNISKPKSKRIFNYAKEYSRLQTEFNDALNSNESIAVTINKIEQCARALLNLRGQVSNKEDVLEKIDTFSSQIDHVTDELLMHHEFLSEYRDISEQFESLIAIESPDEEVIDRMTQCQIDLETAYGNLLSKESGLINLARYRQESHNLAVRGGEVIKDYIDYTRVLVEFKNCDAEFNQIMNSNDNGADKYTRYQALLAKFNGIKAHRPFIASFEHSQGVLAELSEFEAELQDAIENLVITDEDLKDAVAKLSSEELEEWGLDSEVEEIDWRDETDAIARIDEVEADFIEILADDSPSRMAGKFFLIDELPPTSSHFSFEVNQRLETLIQKIDEAQDYLEFISLNSEGLARLPNLPENIRLEDGEVSVDVDIDTEFFQLNEALIQQFEENSIDYLDPEDMATENVADEAASEVDEEYVPDEEIENLIAALGGTTRDSMHEAMADQNQAIEDENWNDILGIFSEDDLETWGLDSEVKSEVEKAMRDDAGIEEQLDTIEADFAKALDDKEPWIIKLGLDMIESIPEKSSDYTDEVNRRITELTEKIHYAKNYINLVATHDETLMSLPQLPRNIQVKNNLVALDLNANSNFRMMRDGLSSLLTKHESAQRQSQEVLTEEHSISVEAPVQADVAEEQSKPMEAQAQTAVTEEQSKSVEDSAQTMREGISEPHVVGTAPIPRLSRKFVTNNRNLDVYLTHLEQQFLKGNVIGVELYIKEAERLNQSMRTSQEMKIDRRFSTKKSRKSHIKQRDMTYENTTRIANLKRLVRIDEEFRNKDGQKSVDQNTLGIMHKQFIRDSIEIIKNKYYADKNPNMSYLKSIATHHNYLNNPKKFEQEMAKAKVQILARQYEHEFLDKVYDEPDVNETFNINGAIEWIKKQAKNDNPKIAKNNITIANQVIKKLIDIDWFPADKHIMVDLQSALQHVLDSSDGTKPLDFSPLDAFANEYFINIKAAKQTEGFNFADVMGDDFVEEESELEETFDMAAEFRGLSLEEIQDKAERLFSDESLDFDDKLLLAQVSDVVKNLMDLNANCDFAEDKTAEFQAILRQSKAALPGILDKFADTVEQALDLVRNNTFDSDENFQKAMAEKLESIEELSEEDQRQEHSFKK